MEQKAQRLELFEVQRFIEQQPRTQKEIADNFNVSRTTVTRAITRLSIYTPLLEERDGRNVVYRFERPVTFQFTPLELSTLILSQEAIISTGRPGTGSPFAESAKSLIDKVRQSIAPALRSRLDSFSKVLGSAIIPAKDFSEHFTAIEQLTKAAAEHRFVRIAYQGLKDKKPRLRKVAPYNVYFDPDGATLKMIGLDEDRQALIVFSIDHISSTKILDETFERPADYDLDTFLEENCFNGIHGKPVKVKLKIYGMTARIFAERKFHPSQKNTSPRRIAKNDQPHLVVEMKVAGGRGLERFVLSWLPDIEVVSPPELRQAIAEITNSSQTRHQK